MFPVTRPQQQRKQEAQKAAAWVLHSQVFSPGKLGAQSEQASVAHIQSVPQQRLVRSLPTVHLFSPMEEFYLRKFMVEPFEEQRLEIAV